MNVQLAKSSMLKVVIDPILRINKQGLVIEQHLHPESDPVIVKLDLLGKNISEFEFLWDTRDELINVLTIQEARTAYFSIPQYPGMKHYEVLIDPVDQTEALAVIKEITKKKQRESELLEYYNLIENIYQGTAAWSGYDFLDQLTLQLSKALRSDYSAICILDENQQELRTVSLTQHGVIAEELSFPIQGSPFKEVVSEGVLHINSDLDKEYPDFLLNQKLKQKKFIGVPIFYNKIFSKPRGMMIAMYGEHNSIARHADKIMQIFSTRAATELEREENMKTLEESEAKVIEAANRYQFLFDNSPVGIIIHTDGVIKHVNAETVRLARGTSAFDFIGKEALSFVHPDSLSAAQKRIDNIYTKKTAHRNEQKFICVDGSIIEVEAMGTLINYDGKPSIQIAFYDISDRKKAELKLIERDEKLESLNNNLAKQNQQLEEFAHLASHNLRAPVTNLLSLIKIKDMDPSPENDQFVWDAIGKTVLNLDETIIELNDVVKTSWELDKKKRTLSFASVLKKILESINHEIESQNAEIITDFENLKSIYYPKVYLESILQNLITNALKYADPSRQPRIFITSGLEENQAFLSVSDNGVGIDLAKYGKRLFGLRKTFHDHKDARGVGLFITKSQVESMGGSIEVTSAVGKGSVFKINFGEL